MNEFATWEMLGTFAGCVATTSLIIQFVKDPLKTLLPQVSTKIWTLLVALLILFTVDLHKGQLSPDTVVLSIINGFIVAMAAMGSYDFGARLIGKGEINDEQSGLS